MFFFFGFRSNENHFLFLKKLAVLSINVETKVTTSIIKVKFNEELHMQFFKIIIQDIY